MSTFLTLKLWTENAERKTAYLAALVGFLVAAALSPKDSFFKVNFLYLWGSQIAVLIPLLLCRPRPAIIAGAAFTTPIYLALFVLYISLSNTDDPSLVVLGYFFSLPGAIIGGLTAVFLLRNRLLNRVIATILATSGLVLLGLSINQAIVCKTIMYCPLV